MRKLITLGRFSQDDVRIVSMLFLPAGQGAGDGRSLSFTVKIAAELTVVRERRVRAVAALPAVQLEAIWKVSRWCGRLMRVQTVTYGVAGYHNTIRAWLLAFK